VRSAVLFRSSELWKNIQALGGSKSIEWSGRFGSTKGTPKQYTSYSISAVPARVKQMAVIDRTRKAS
jgi:hypothetical protein